MSWPVVNTIPGRCASTVSSFWARLTIREISGSCGDLGVFIPLVVGMVKTNGLDLGTTLVFTGAYNVITGVAFGIPMPVQPMKTIAAVALSGDPLTVPQIMAAGMFVSISVLLLGATGLMGLAQSLIPMAVVRGLQLGVGLVLAKKGFQQVWYLDSQATASRSWWGAEGLLLGLFSLSFLLLSVYSQRDGPAPSHALPLLPTVTPAANAAVRAGLDTAVPSNPQQAQQGGDYRDPQLPSDPKHHHHQHLEQEPPQPPQHLQQQHLLLAVSPSQAEQPLQTPPPSRPPPATPSAPAGSLSDSSDESCEEPPPPVHPIRPNKTQGGGSRGREGGDIGPEGGQESDLLLGGTGQKGGLGIPQRDSWIPWIPKDLTQRLTRQLRASVGGDSPASQTVQTAAGGGCATGASRTRSFQVPSALVVTLVGLLISLISHPQIWGSLALGPSIPRFLVPSGSDWKIGILRAGLPQLSLTTFNSVISVCQLAQELFPHRPASPNAVAVSVGAMNLVGGWWGALPACHGAGGLAAQARFGASSGAAPVFLGLTKLTLGLVLGSSLIQILRAFPQTLMGSMLVYAGIELAACARRQRGERGMAVMLLTAAVSLALSNVAAGVAAGLFASYLLLASDLLRGWLGGSA